MFLVGIFQWWYGTGWLRHVRRSYAGVLRTANTFSLSLLLKTLFSPFKQISAANVGGSPPVQFQAFLDKTFSRAVGAFIRTFTVLFGTVSLRSGCATYYVGGLVARRSENDVDKATTIYHG